MAIRARSDRRAVAVVHPARHARDRDQIGEEERDHELNARHRRDRPRDRRDRVDHRGQVGPEAVASPSPRPGRVAALHYYPGEFLDARHGECAVRNEQFWTDFTDERTGQLSANDPDAVADWFARLLQGEGPFRGVFRRVAFAVLDGSAGGVNLRPFERRFPR